MTRAVLAAAAVMCLLAITAPAALSQTNPIRFTREGFHYTVESSLQAQQLSVRVQFVPDDRPALVGQAVMAISMQRLLITSRSTTGVVMNFTVTPMGTGRLRGTYSRGNLTRQITGSDAEVLRFFQTQAVATQPTSPRPGGATLGQLLLSDPALRGDVRQARAVSFAGTPQGARDRWLQARKPFERGYLTALCERAEEACKNGSGIGCLVMTLAE